MWRDLQYGLRQWRRNKLFGLTVVLLLSIGIGANTLIFSFVNELLLKPLPVRDPDNLFLLEKTRIKQVRPDPSFFYRQFEEVTRKTNVFSSAIAEQEWSDLSLHSFSTGDATRLVTTQIVSPNYFAELGVRAIAGRVLTEKDAAEQADVPVVLSYQFWQSQFDGKRGVIGQAIRVKDYPFVVVGILPEEFHSLDVERAPDIRFPISAARRLTGGTVDEPLGERPILFSIPVRMAPGISIGHAQGAAVPTLQGMEAGLWRDWWKRSSPPRRREDLEERVQYEQNYRLQVASVARGVSRLREQFSHSVLLDERRTGGHSGRSPESDAQTGCARATD